MQCDRAGARRHSSQRPAAWTLPHAAWSEYTYLPNGRLSTLTDKDASGNVLSRYFAPEYAGTGGLLTLIAEVSGSGFGGATPWTGPTRAG